MPDTFLEPGIFNVYCPYCYLEVSYETKEGEVSLISGQYQLTCPSCARQAKVIGRPGPVIRVGDDTSIQRQIHKNTDDPDRLTAVQEWASKNRQQEIALSPRKRKYYQEQKEAASKNKPEWVRRGRKPEERLEAVKG